MKLLLLIVIASASACRLCSNNATFLNDECREVDRMISKLSHTSNICKRVKRKFKSCCEDPPPTQSPTSLETGPYDRCDLCFSKEPPRDDFKILRVLYFGQGTCMDYYYLGLKGHIRGIFCAPFQYIASQLCDCP